MSRSLNRHSFILRLKRSFTKQHLLSVSDSNAAGELGSKERTRKHAPCRLDVNAYSKFATGHLPSPIQFRLRQTIGLWAVVQDVGHKVGLDFGPLEALPSAAGGVVGKVSNQVHWSVPYRRGDARASPLGLYSAAMANCSRLGCRSCRYPQAFSAAAAALKMNFGSPLSALIQEAR